MLYCKERWSVPNIENGFKLSRCSSLRTSKFTFLPIVLLLLSAGNAQAAKQDFSSKVGPFFKKHCLQCHGSDRSEGDVRVDEVSDDLDDLNLSLIHI